MANVFIRTNESTKKPNRNTFDLSFVNNLTLRMGQLVPVFCKEVMDGDSVHIKPTFGFNLHPTIFPVQTKMKASLHFFYVRNRALWRGWQDFITKQENRDGDSTPPYITLNVDNRDMFNTGDIGDYFGVPTVYYKNGYETINYPVSVFADDKKMYVYGTNFMANGFGQTFFSRFLDDATIDQTYMPEYRPQKFQEIFVDSLFSSENNNGIYPSNFKYYPELLDRSQQISLMARCKIPASATYFSISRNDYLSLYSAPSVGYNSLMQINASQATSNVYRVIFVVGNKSHKLKAYFIAKGGSDSFSSTRVSTYNSTYLYYPDSSEKLISVDFKLTDVSNEDDYNYVFFATSGHIITSLNGVSAQYSEFDLPVALDGRYGIRNEDRPIDSLPFSHYNTNPAEDDKIRISALPFRAYEAIYNSFYRDDRNNPLIIDGKPLYNTYVVNDHGGRDLQRYKLYNRNWESDAYTTAVQSPQQGIAPLVGVTATGRMTFQDEDGNTYQMQLSMEDDGTIKGIKSYSSDMPRGTLHAMVDSISSGISINDFRNVNALQRWLETNMRKGYRYKDVLEAHFGYAPTYSELNIPEFIGGMSRDIEMNRVVQTNQSADPNVSPLGTLAGSASVLGSGKSEISHFCDEHGWIIGIMCVTPVPVYSQQLSKQLCKQELLDYYFPEFGHIGYQPIFNKEIAALQCSDEEGKRLNDVFGYQRPWHEYLASIDEVHGDFRTNMKDFLIQRVFSDVPQLSKEFLIIDSDVAENIFAVRDDSDKIFGQLYFDVKMKRPIPALGIPRLE